MGRGKGIVVFLKWAFIVIFSLIPLIVSLIKRKDLKKTLEVLSYVLSVLFFILNIILLNIGDFILIVIYVSSLISMIPLVITMAKDNEDKLTIPQSVLSYIGSVFFTIGISMFLISYLMYASNHSKKFIISSILFITIGIILFILGYFQVV